MGDRATTIQAPYFLRQLEEGRAIDKRLPKGGRLYMDRPLPFLCVYRHPPERPEEITARLVTTQASYLLAASEAAYHDDIADLVANLCRALVHRFGRVLVLEIWESPDRGDSETEEPYRLQPSFQVFAPQHRNLEDTVDSLMRALRQVTVHQLKASAHVTENERPAPRDLQPLASCSDLSDDSCFVIGVEVDPVYRDAETGSIYPFLFDELRRHLAVAVKKAFFQFASADGVIDAPNFLALGRRALEQSVSQVDEGLASIDESFDFLLQSTPINAEEAWADFESSGFDDDPVLRYRPLPVDPELLKRRLFDLPIERVEDPGLSWLFREKQEELDRMITMLRDRDTRRFFYGSLQLYGQVDHDLLLLARDILDGLPKRDYDLGARENLDPEAFAEMAVVEFDHYRKSCEAFPDTVQIRYDMPAGLMVSRGHLLIGHQTRVPAPRVEPLLHHEVGTHMLTYYNGRAQPLRLLNIGLAGYEALQEGIAVLAEYLCGGLSIPRLRVLAARVVSAHSMIEGSTFVDLFRMLRTDFDFDEREAYSITLRTFRGGGLIKDVIYLRGLHELLEYIRSGGELADLFVGKIALHHLPLITELRDRGILREVPLRPRYLEDERARERLAALQGERTVVDLIEN